MKTILIIGAYGLVCSNICKKLERDFPDIKIKKVKFDEVYGYFEDSSFDYIIYGAGYGQPLKFVEDKINTIRINTEVLYDTFKLLKPNGKFLYISSSEVYSGAKSPYKETDIGTTTPQHPRACYIEGKRCGEAICMAYKEQGYDVKIARLALAYGEGTKKGDTRVINQFIEQALTTGEIVMRDKGEAIRTYLYIDDCVEMLTEILFEGKSCVYNVGGVSGTSIYELAVLIGELTGTKVIQGSEPLVGSPDDVKLSLSKTLKEFPRRFIELNTGIKLTVNYQKQLYGQS